MAEITDAGLLVDTLDTKLATLNADFVTEFGSGVNGIDTSARSYTGRQNTILAASDVQLQQLLAELLTLFNLGNAQNRFLDFIGTLWNEPRLPAAAALISARLYGTPGFNVGDRRIRYLRNSTVWRVPIGTLINPNGSVDVTISADIAGLLGPDGRVIEAFTDGTDQWSIVDSNPNFLAAESLADSSPGRDVEGDPSYRARLRVAGRGSLCSTAPGVLRALQRVAGSTARIDNNRALTPNANGVPGKQIEALVDGGTDEAVAQAILDSYSDTAGFFGTTSAVAFDPNGNPVTVLFTRIDRIFVVWDVTLNTTGAETELPDNAVAVVQQALADYTNALDFGGDVLPAEGAAVIRSALPKGVLPETGLTVLVGLKGGPPPAASPVVITSRQRAITNPEPQSATVVGTKTGPFNIIAGQVLQLAVDGGSAQDVVFTVADFQFISAASTLEVATAINNGTSGIVAGSQQGALVIRSATTGSSSSILVGTGSDVALLAELGLNLGTTFGSDSDITVTVTP